MASIFPGGRRGRRRPPSLGEGLAVGGLTLWREAWVWMASTFGGRSGRRWPPSVAGGLAVGALDLSGEALTSVASLFRGRPS